MTGTDTLEAWKDLLDEHYGVYTDELAKVDTKKIHFLVEGTSAWWDWNNSYLLVAGTQDTANKFLYYIGAENEATVVLKIGNLWMFDGVDPERIETYV